MISPSLTHVVEASAPRAEDAGARGDEPEVGKWYWVSDAPVVVDETVSKTPTKEDE